MRFRLDLLDIFHGSWSGPQGWEESVFKTTGSSKFAQQDLHLSDLLKISNETDSLNSFILHKVDVRFLGYDSL
jgi:hypothetical protein